MRVAIYCGVLLWAGVLVAAPHLPGNLEKVFLFGNQYVRLGDWARANHCQVKWLTPGHELQVFGPACNLIVTADARRVSLNGVRIWLSAPIIIGNNTALIAPVDLLNSIQPVLSPPRRGRKIKTITLDPGHGGSDPGNQEGRLQEKKYTLLFARDLGELLSKAGFNVKYTRTSDTKVELGARPQLAKSQGADLLLSLHFNSADGPGGSAVKGAEVYCMTPARTSSTNDRKNSGGNLGLYPGNRFDSANMLLAYQIQKALVRGARVEDRGVHRARFEVLREAEMPAVLIEAAFMTNPTDAIRIYDPAGRRNLAQAILAGVVGYKKLVEE